MATSILPPAVRAFDAIADKFDQRFSEWRSVAVQRRAVREELKRAFAPGARLIEVGGGTGEDAVWMAGQGCDVLMTDASPAMVRQAAEKFAGQPRLDAEVVTAEELEDFARGKEGTFDGAWSNFAGLNCVTDLGPVAGGLARLIRPGGAALLVLFGSCSPGEIVVEALRGRPSAMFRRFATKPVPARLGGQEFTVSYHRADAIKAAMAPWFAYEGRLGIGVFVPPSAAEPWISRHPQLLSLLETLDRSAARPLAMFGDHVLYRFVRKAEG